MRAELNGLGARYGFAEEDIQARLLEAEFRPTSYTPFSRHLVALEQHQTTGNTLYVRPSAALEQRLREAPAVRLGGLDIDI